MSEGDESIIIDWDGDSVLRKKQRPVAFDLDDVPPTGTSAGWGDMSWTNAEKEDRRRRAT